jgi:hypothetical protein
MKKEKVETVEAMETLTVTESRIFPPLFLLSQIQELSPKAKEVLQRNAEPRQRDNRFIKIGPGEKKLMTFDPEKIEQV